MDSSNQVSSYKRSDDKVKNSLVRIDENLNSVGKKLREMIQYAKNLLKENKIMINKRKVEVIF